MSKRRARTSQTHIERSVESKLLDGYSFYYVEYQNSTLPILAKNIYQAFGLLRVWLNLPAGIDLGFENGSCAVVSITQTPPQKFVMFGGRRRGNAIASMISL